MMWRRPDGSCLVCEGRGWFYAIKPEGRDKPYFQGMARRHRCWSCSHDTSQETAPQTAAEACQEAEVAEG